LVYVPDPDEKLTAFPYTPQRYLMGLRRGKENGRKEKGKSKEGSLGGASRHFFSTLSTGQHYHVVEIMVV